VNPAGQAIKAILYSSMQYRSVATSLMTAIERQFVCSDGITLASLYYRGTSSSLTMGNRIGSTSTITPPNISTSFPPQNSDTNRSSTNSSRKVLCLHGWLDNAASFHMVAPELIRRGSVSEVIALDLPGHGMSSHKSADCPPQLLADYIFYIADVIQQLHWCKGREFGATTTTTTTNDSPKIPSPSGEERNKEESHTRVTLIGHSMGAALSVLFASCFPETVESIVLLDGFAPLPKDARDISSHIRRAVETRLATNQRLYPQYSGGPTISTSTTTSTTNTYPIQEESTSIHLSSSRSHHTKKVYHNIHKAVEARLKTATSSPGNQYISKEAAYALVKRATIPVTNSHVTSTSSGNGQYDDEDDDVPVQFRHDPRLYWPSMQYLTTEQVEAVLTDVRCPVCLLMAKDGWPIDTIIQRKIVDHLLKPKMYQTLPGSHHFHADPDASVAVVNSIEQFFNLPL
jgi:pimeloyl-ACP methyl ester carboxylesterase